MSFFFFHYFSFENLKMLQTIVIFQIIFGCVFCLSSDLPNRSIECGKGAASLKENISSPSAFGSGEINFWGFYGAIAGTDGEPFCGAVLIGSRWLITLNNCIEIRTPSFVRLNMSSAYDLTNSSPNVLHIKIKNIFQRYLNDYDKNHTALIELETEVDFVKYPTVRTICLFNLEHQNLEQFYSKKQYLLLDWHLKSQPKLFPLVVNVINNTECLSVYDLCIRAKVNTSEHLTKDGILLTWDKFTERYYLAGVASNFFQFRDGTLTASFTKVGYYSDLIDAFMRH